jgi:chromosome partitioning protein
MSPALLKRVQEDMAVGLPKVLLLVGKGGGGKSSTAIHLALAALKRKFRVAILDLDFQKCSETWRKIRNRDDVAVNSMTLAEAVSFLENAEARDYDLLIVDCGKGPSAQLGAVVDVADFVLVPTRPSFFDLPVTLDWIEWLRAHQTSFAVVLNAAPPRRRLPNQPADGTSPKLRDSPLVRQVRDVLIQKKVPFWLRQISHRHGVIETIAKGRGLVELAPNHPVSQEIEDLLDTLLRHLKMTGDQS